MSKSIKVFSPATVSNVTCGFDVLGFALEKPGDIIVARENASKGAHINQIIGSQNIPIDPLENVATVAANALLKHLGSGAGIEFTLYKNIKPGSGIGSSASSATAAVFATNQLLGTPIKNSFDLLPFAMAGEQIASGAFHADNVAPALLGGFVIVRSNDPLDVIQLGTPPDLYAVVIHPDLQIKTAESRKLLPKQVPLKDVVTQTGNLAGLVAGPQHRGPGRAPRHGRARTRSLARSRARPLCAPALTAPLGFWRTKSEAKSELKVSSDRG